MIEAVIFDLDGTLIKLPVDYEKLFSEFRNVLQTDNVQPLTEVLSELDDNKRSQVFKLWDKAELDAIPHTAILKEGMKIYESYSLKPRALVTMQGKTTVKHITEKFKLSFDFKMTREDSLNRKKQLENAAEKLRIRISDVLFVGDTENDYRAAKEVGCQFLKVSKLTKR